MIICETCRFSTSVGINSIYQLTHQLVDVSHFFFLMKTFPSFDNSEISIINSALVTVEESNSVKAIEFVFRVSLFFPLIRSVRCTLEIV